MSEAQVFICSGRLMTVPIDHTAYDRGDLCVELDQALGDLIERIAHRYIPKQSAHNLRRKTITDIADSVIAHDTQSNSHSA